MMTHNRSQDRPRGLTVVAVLVCLIVIALVSSAVLRVGLAQRDFARSRERRLQAEWLVESGLERRSRPARDRSRLHRGDLGIERETSAGRRGKSRLWRPKKPPAQRRSSPSPSNAFRKAPTAAGFACRPIIPVMSRAVRGGPSKC